MLLMIVADEECLLCDDDYDDGVSRSCSIHLLLVVVVVNPTTSCPIHTFVVHRLLLLLLWIVVQIWQDGE